MNHTVIGIDIVNRDFQLHCVDIESGEMVSVRLRRKEFLETLANRASSLIGMMARGRMRHWTRELEMLGHQVVPLPVRTFEPCVCGNKNEQQVLRALHRMRTQLVGFRSARARLAGYRRVPQGRAAIPLDIRSTLKLLIKRMPNVLIDTLCEQYARLSLLDEQAKDIGSRLTVGAASVTPKLKSENSILRAELSRPC